MHQEKATSASLSIWTLIEAVQKEQRTLEADQQALRSAPASLPPGLMGFHVGGVDKASDIISTPFNAMTQKSLPSLSEVVQLSRARRVSLSINTFQAQSSTSFSPESPLSAPLLHSDNTSPNAPYYHANIYNKDSLESSEGTQNSFLNHHHPKQSFWSLNASFPDEPKKRYLCHICNKRFSRPSALTQHIRTHTGEKVSLP